MYLLWTLPGDSEPPIAEIVVHLGYLAGTTSTIDENDIYRGIEKQKMIVKIYSDIIEIRERLEKRSQSPSN